MYKPHEDRRELPFPTLIKYCTIPDQKELSQQKEISPSKEKNIYRLDWSFFDKRKKEKPCHYEAPSVKALPDKYESLLEDLKFAISYPLIDEIRRNVRQAIEERNVKRGLSAYYESMVEKTCEAHVEVAFALLTDCLFDVNKNDWDREQDKIIILSMMLYKFWHNQVPKKELKRLALFFDLERNNPIVDEEENIDDSHKQVIEYMKTIKEYEETYNIGGYKKKIGSSMSL